ncbi:CubicO group peptidase (beta-lactamase class C family) [Maribacter spongiicola]|uniref:CubicO group peptidase (Beta-lactamase class C family) n=1 Tax=Maribacter spongiicola TaxID=1206753 RepID=A0A4R7JLX7_9FLAO|nr:serine hydrolase domain-containing protein [Maribacter spongiicola]TDT38674.1 CubicO group peptidase (beta-lactamase class C family) [Maribacter spongiicola]
MNPILKYLKNVFAAKRVLADDSQLSGLVKADFLLQELIKHDRAPGIAITVLKDGKTIFQKGYGYADLEQKQFIDTRKSICRVASVSKPIAATALAYMVQEGLIDLDESFYTYLPDYPKKEWDFTIRQLASHTAGIRVYKGKEYGLNKPLSIKEGLDIFKNDPLVYEPGTEYLYNSFDWVMISAAMQKASGIPFEEYVQENVLNPLGMKNTYIPECHSDDNYKKSGIDVNTIASSEEQNQVATFYTKGISGFRKAIPVDNFYKLAGGGYLSTSADIAKFGQAFLDKKVEIKESILNQFLTAQQVNGNSTYYGLGWQVSEDAKGRKFFGHVGNGVGGCSNFFVYPKEQLVFSILVNCTDPKIQGELDAVINCFFDEVDS